MEITTGLRTRSAIPGTKSLGGSEAEERVFGPSGRVAPRGCAQRPAGHDRKARRAKRESFSGRSAAELDSVDTEGGPRNLRVPPSRTETARDRLRANASITCRGGSLPERSDADGPDDQDDRGDGAQYGCDCERQLAGGFPASSRSSAPMVQSLFFAWVIAHRATPSRRATDPMHSSHSPPQPTETNVWSSLNSA